MTENILFYLACSSFLVFAIYVYFLTDSRNLKNENDL